MRQLLIALDQLANCCVYAHGEGFGMADETLSARCWRLRDHTPRWRRARRVIDALFWWEPDHCRIAHESERLRRHLPPGYSS
nr:hypothetical protein [Marinobacterium litorale]